MSCTPDHALHRFIKTKLNESFAADCPQQHQLVSVLARHSLLKKPGAVCKDLRVHSHVGAYKQRQGERCSSTSALHKAPIISLDWLKMWSRIRRGSSTVNTLFSFYACCIISPDGNTTFEMLMLQLCSKAGMKITSDPQNNSNVHNNRD